MNKKIADAMDRLSEERPYLSGIIFAMKPVEVNKIEKIQVTEKWILAYNKDFVENRHPDDLMADIYRLALGMAMQQKERMAHLPNNKVKSMAAILASSSIMKKEGIIESDAITPDMMMLPSDLSLEVYHREIMKKLDQSESDESEGEGEGEGRQQGKSQRGGRGQGSRGDSNANGEGGGEGEGEGSQQDGGQPGQGAGTSSQQSGGSGGGGRQGDQADPFDPNNMPELGSGITGSQGDFEQELEAEGLSKKDIDDVIEQMKTEIQKKSQQSESEFRHHMGRGTEPGEIFRELDLEPDTEFHNHIQWDQVLRKLIGNAVSQNTLSARKRATMSKRHSYQDEVDQTWPQPTLLMGRQRTGLRIGIMFDVSGSMSAEFLTKGFKQAKAITDKIPGSSIDLYRADTRVVDSFKNVRQLRPEHVVEGEGGTDLGAALQEICQTEPRGYDVMIVMTDGFTGEWPEMAEIPKIRKMLVWLVKDSPAARTIIPKEYGAFVVGQSRQVEYGNQINQFKLRRY